MSTPTPHRHPHLPPVWFVFVDVHVSVTPYFGVTPIYTLSNLLTSHKDSLKICLHCSLNVKTLFRYKDNIFMVFRVFCCFFFMNWAQTQTGRQLRESLGRPGSNGKTLHLVPLTTKQERCFPYVHPVGVRRGQRFLRTRRRLGSEIETGKDLRRSPRRP